MNHKHKRQLTENIRSTCLTQRRSGAGLTLIEVLISLVILTIITVISFSIFKIMSDAWKQGTETMLEVQNARTFLEMMHKDVSSAFLGETDDIFFGGDENSLFFIMLENIDGEVSDLIEVGYFKENSFICKHFQAEPDFDFLTSDLKDVVCENVILFNLSYYNGEEWTSEWNSKSTTKLPRSIKVILKTLIEDKENTYETVICIFSSGNGD